MKNRVAVLGGGIAGVTVATELAKKGYQVDLIEQGGGLGGLHRSVHLDGMTFDIGAFFFSDVHELIKTFPFLAPDFIHIKLKQISITPTGNVDMYPMTLRGYLQHNGPVVFLQSVLDMAFSRIKHHRRDTTPAYAKFYMGSTIYKRSGLKNYIERLYGMKDDDVAVEFAEQRLFYIQDYTLNKVVRRALTRLWKRRTGRRIKTVLVRPAEGFEKVYGRIHEHLIAQGVRVCLNSKVLSIKHADGGFTLHFDTEERTYERVVSTIPPTIVLKLFDIPVQTRTEHMHLYSMFFRGTLTTDAAVVYNFTNEGRWKRMTVYSRLYGKHEGQDYMTVEVTTNDTSEESLASLQRDFEQHTSGLGLFQTPPEIVGGVVTPRAYPIFRGGEKAIVEREKAKLAELGISAAGRQGNFKYLSSHQTVSQAKQLAQDFAPVL